MSPASPTTSASTTPQPCLVCSARLASTVATTSSTTTTQPPPAEYAPVPCGHRSLCKSCAMKQATGGKCRLCGGFFAEVKRVEEAREVEEGQGVGSESGSENERED
ncbi:uncharacterized protein EV422DRAFT_327910 [Fimicolochytrium jonesii]|uniref:uncharacterized protein n=1 Tax=Fimicolochytrium jonesii TaxID=1396493 RepID=UPI0022FDBEFB|nr:uncharacterized protein EV422DRAFT_327910 [Fimicolochytrium jonesii]KAI8816143.1 hypothetical protein EV422DRAFT_327910 [Fimicolochytrium jonesii]